MSEKASDDKNVATVTTLSRPAAQRTVVSKITGCGPVSNTVGRRTTVVVSKLYDQSCEGRGYNTGPDGLAYDPTPRDVPVDNQTLRRRQADGEKSIPTTDGRPAAGPKMIIRPKEGEVDPEAVPLPHKAPPPSEVPEWSDGEVMPLIIIEHNSGVVIPKTTDRRVPVGSDILLPESLEMNNSEEHVAKSGQERPFSGYAS